MGHQGWSRLARWPKGNDRIYDRFEIHFYHQSIAHRSLDWPPSTTRLQLKFWSAIKSSAATLSFQSPSPRIALPPTSRCLILNWLLPMLNSSIHSNAMVASVQWPGKFAVIESPLTKSTHYLAVIGFDKNFSFEFPQQFQNNIFLVQKTSKSK